MACCDCLAVSAVSEAFFLRRHIRCDAMQTALKRVMPCTQAIEHRALLNWLRTHRSLIDPKTTCCCSAAVSEGSENVLILVVSRHALGALNNPLF